VHNFHARANGVNYSLFIRVPPDYATTYKVYPVIYMLDADYSFAIAGNVVDMLARRFDQAQEAIVVGIGYPNQYPDDQKYRVNRTRDYTPAPLEGTAREDQASGAPGAAVHGYGGAPRFLRVIEREIIPYIENTYRADPSDRTLVGHSYGGLFAAWVLEENPDLFHRYLMVSPSLWYNNEMILKREEQRGIEPLEHRTLVYLAVGSWENPRGGAQMIDEMNRFATLLDARHDPNLVEQHRTFEDETHASIFPVAFSTGIRHLFGTMEGRPPREVAAGTGH
jgi:predicted alpha/beta superfamily hydrolase